MSSARAQGRGAFSNPLIPHCRHSEYCEEALGCVCEVDVCHLGSSYVPLACRLGSAETPAGGTPAATPIGFRRCGRARSWHHVWCHGFFTSFRM